MRVLILSPYPLDIAPAIEAAGDMVDLPPPPKTERLRELRGGGRPPDEALMMDWSAPDWIVSYGYQHILREPVLQATRRPILNIHISYLPWNRGSDPNFWSWYDNTAKGVSIHAIDKGIDTGPIYAQREVTFSDPAQETLATTYTKLRVEAVKLFAETWPVLRTGSVAPTPQLHRGTYHRSQPWGKLLAKGFDTPVAEIIALGRARPAMTDAMRREISGGDYGPKAVTAPL
jgi:hypothetical protein